MEIRKVKYRVLRDFTDHEGNQRKIGDEIEMPALDARTYVNSDKIAADLGSKQGA